MKNDFSFQIFVTNENLFLESEEEEAFVELVLMPLVKEWLKTHDGVCPSA